MSLYYNDEIRSIVVDSSNRISGTSTNFTINLNLPNNCQDYDRVALNQISIPRSYYDVDMGTNTFTLKENLLTATITIPIGLYNVNTFNTVLTNQLNLMSPNGLTYTVAYPSPTTTNTNKYTYTVSGALTVSFIFTTSLYQQCGFSANSTNTFSAGVLVSTNSISISYINRLFLKSNMCGTSQDSLLQEILIAGQFPSTSYIYYENTNFDINSKVFSNNKDSVWNFQLYDRYGNIVNLNGQEIVFTLKIYRKGKTSELLYNHYKIQNLEKLHEDIPDEVIEDMNHTPEVV